MPKHTPETKRLGSLRQHWFAFAEAISAATLAMKYQNGSTEEEKSIGRSLSFQAITSYARPFTQCNGIGAPRSEGDKQLIDLRNQITAHLDALSHVYVTKVIIANGRAINLSGVPTLLGFMPKVIEESNKELKRTEEEAAPLEERIAKLGLADGEYE